MRRSATKYLLSVGLLSLGTLALTSSCADNNSSLFLVGVIDIGSSTCLAKADTTVTYLASGTMDLAFVSSYTAAVLVGNQLTQRGDREQLRTETSRVSLRGAEITLTTLDGREIGNYSTVGTGFVDASAGDVPSYGSMFVNIIPPALGASDTVKNAKIVLAKIRVFGDTLGNTSITSSELDFPISVCEGCLVRYPAEAADTTVPAGSGYLCSTATTTMQTTDAAPCVQGQDQPFACTFCSGSYAVCRDPHKNPSYADTAP
jgi:hypothetical protein